MSEKNRIKLIALYLPQFHKIPENDQWWGNGFTDWTNVKSARPMFKGHHQPRIPLDEYYYDQSRLETLCRQVDLAKAYKVYGFCHYHYWFDGKQMLQTPTNLMLANKNLALPFCLSWANETWVKRWNGKSHQVLIKQTHPPQKDRWKAHFDYLIKAWSDERAIKINGKPIFIIYRPHYIPKIEDMLAYWRENAVACGLKGLYFIAQKQYDFPSPKYLKGFDAVFQFQPFESVYSLGYGMNTAHHNIVLKMIRKFPELFQDLFRSLHTKLIRKPTFYDYNDIWQQCIRIVQENKMTIYPGAFVDWDNTARYQNRATIFRGASPEKFAAWLTRLIHTIEDRHLPENFIFLNAWNEWAEAAYLEPDTRNQHKYLEAVEQVLTNYEQRSTAVFKK